MNTTDHGITCHCRKCTDYWDQDHSTMTHIPSPYGAFPMPDNTLGEIGHNGIGLPTQDRHPATPLHHNVITLSGDQCQLLLTGKIIGIRIGSNPDVSPEIMTLGVKIPDDLTDTTMVSWSLHNAVVRKLEEQRNGLRSTLQDERAEAANIRARVTNIDDRLHKASLAREEARAERDYERKRWQDDQGVWLETRDANKRLTDEVAALKEQLRIYQTMYYPKEPA